VGHRSLELLSTRSSTFNNVHNSSVFNQRAVRAYGPLFKNLLPEDETLLNAAPAIHVEISERYGKGTGDGTLAITDRRVIFIYAAKIFKNPGFAFNIRDVTSCSKSWIVLPGSSNLRFTGFADGAEWTHNFYCSKHFCKEVTSGF
jgi:hypothetical protein